MALIMEHWVLDGMMILTTLVIVIYFFATRNFKYWQKRGVLQLTPTPFMGNFTECLLLRKNPGDFLKNVYDQAKGLPYIGFYILDKPFLLVRDQELIKNIFIKDFNHFCDRYSSANVNDRLGYANLFSLKNPAWKIVRAKLTPFFTSGKLKKMFGLMLECADNLDEYLDSLELKDKGKITDIKDIAAKFTLNVISSTAYGLDVNPFKDPNVAMRTYGKMIFQTNYTRAFELLAVFFLPNIVKLTRRKLFGKETTIFLRKLFWEAINQRIESGQKRNDLIDILVELKKNHSDQDIEGFKFDGDDLSSQAASFFSAGFEGTATPVVFALYELALHPEIQDTLRKEILEALDASGGKITYDMPLPYLEMVISETLRMYPPLAFLNRTTMQTYKVPNSDLVLEKSTPVYISILGLHYDPKYFPNPNKFDPERFNEENKYNMSCIYLPFGEGPHMCIGMRFALLQLKLILIKILSKCVVTPCDKTLIPMKYNPMMSMTQPLGGTIYLNMQKINTTAN